MPDLPILKSKYEGMTYEEIVREESVDLMLDVHLSTYNAVIKKMTPEEERTEREEMRVAFGILFDTGDEDSAMDALPNG